MQKWIFELRSRPFVILVFTFVVLTFLVMSKATEDFDQKIIGYFYSLEGNSVLDLLMWFITEIGDIYYMLLFGIVLLILRRTRRIGLSLMICLVLATLATGYIKCGVDRDRPSLEFSGTEFPIPSSYDTFSLFCEGGFTASYPSGHAARAAIFGVILGYSLSARFPRGCYLMLLYPFLMSISRVYVLQHFPMDVIGGTILGILIAGTIGHKSKLYKQFESKTKTF